MFGKPATALLLLLLPPAARCCCCWEWLHWCLPHYC
jgi:hypothetical protein